MTVNQFAGMNVLLPFNNDSETVDQSDTPKVDNVVSISLIE
jgi:hypothetical protein